MKTRATFLLILISLLLAAPFSWAQTPDSERDAGTIHSREAIPTVTINPIVLTDLAAFAGQYVHAFAVNATESILGSDHRLVITRVFSNTSITRISAEGTAEIPEMRVALEQLSSFNRVVFVIRNASESFFFRNLNGTEPLDPRLTRVMPAPATTSFEFSAMGHLSRTRLDTVLGRLPADARQRTLRVRWSSALIERVTP